MAKIQLGKAPQNFYRVVKFELLDGSKSAIQMNYKYRTRKQYGAYVDESVERAKVAAEAAVADAVARLEAAEATPSVRVPGMKDVLSKASDDNVEFILGAADGWNLDAPFGRESVEQLVDEYPQAALAIIDSYRMACTEGRQGN